MQRSFGEVPERSNGLAWKASVRFSRTEGSNRAEGELDAESAKRAELPGAKRRASAERRAVNPSLVRPEGPPAVRWLS